MKRVLIILIFLVFPALAFAEQIDINSATLSQLDKLTGIGPKYAQAIIDARPFSSLDDLDRVKGIGPATLQKIKTQGFACVACATVIPSLTGNPAPDNKNTQSALDSRLRGNDVTGVFISELMPNPEGADETNEWIKLYNSNAFLVDLSGWQLQDKTGTITTYKIPENTKILANGFLVFKRSDTKIMLNNDEDGLNLLTPDGKTADTISFTKAPLNQPYRKTSAGWAWSTTNKSPSTGSGSGDLPKNKNSVKNNVAEAGLADIIQSIPEIHKETKTENPWFLFFIALAITIISASFVLLIKVKIKNHVRT